MSARVGLSLLVCLLLQSPAAMRAQKPTVASAAWLAGCWSGENRGQEFTEQWMKPAGEAMLGMSRTVAKNKLADYEFLQIRQQDDGEVYYIAKPSRQPEAAFKLIKAGPQELIFENLQHDFPQRIIYRLAGDGSLVARIEGTKNGQSRGVDFPMKRVKCD
jgi:hypothetical protein